MADVAHPIIGADLLHYFGLLIDVRRNRLVDLHGQSSVETMSVDNVDAPMFSVSRSLKWSELLC